MALVSAKSKSTLKKPLQSEFLDITSNLPTLQFESAILNEYKEYSILRARSHSITASICSQIVYLIRVLNEIRDRNLSLKYYGRNKTARILMDDVPGDPLRVGIIGGGRMGTHIAESLLTYGEVRPAELKISTRRPDVLEKFQKMGVTCVYDNADVTKSSNLIILATLPSQFPVVAEEIKQYLTKRTIVYSIMPSVPIARLRQLLNFQFIVKPDIILSEDENKKWDFTLDLDSVFQDEEMVEKTCPLGPKREKNVVQTTSKLAEVFFYSAMNMCTQLHIPRSHSLIILHDVMLGLDEEEDANLLQERSFTRMEAGPDESFPKFDTSIIAENNTPLTRRLHDQKLQDLFVEKYVSYFIEHTHKVKMGVLRS